MTYLSKAVSQTATVVDVKAAMRPMIGSIPLEKKIGSGLVAAQGQLRSNGKVQYIRCWVHRPTGDAKSSSAGYWCLRMNRDNFTKQDFEQYAATIQFLQ